MSNKNTAYMQPLNNCCMVVEIHYDGLTTWYEYKLFWFTFHDIFSRVFCSSQISLKAGRNVIIWQATAITYSDDSGSSNPVFIKDIEIQGRCCYCCGCSTSDLRIAVWGRRTRTTYVLSTRCRFVGRKVLNCTCSELETHTGSNPRTPIWRSLLSFSRSWKSFYCHDVVLN